MANKYKGVQYKTFKNLVEQIIDENNKIFAEQIIYYDLSLAMQELKQKFSTKYYYRIYKYGFQSLGFTNPMIIARKGSEYYNQFIQEPSEYGSRMVNEDGDLIANDKQFIAFTIAKDLESFVNPTKVGQTLNMLMEKYK